MDIEKEKRAIKYLRSFEPEEEPYYLCYSGGKDSDAIRILAQLAEECAELGKAALKLARIVRKENPTPVTKEEALENLREEYTDVVQCARELALTTDFVTMTAKKERFFERWKQHVADR